MMSKKLIAKAKKQESQKKSIKIGLRTWLMVDKETPEERITAYVARLNTNNVIWVLLKRKVL